MWIDVHQALYLTSRRAKNWEIKFVIPSLQKLIVWSEMPKELTKSQSKDKTLCHVLFSISKGDIQELRQ